MPRSLRRLALAVVCATVAAFAVGTNPAGAAGLAQPWTPNAVPMDRTPQVLDTADATGRVVDFAAVGNRIVAAGNFQQIRNAPGNGGATFTQPYIFSFDPVSGAIDQSFVPQVNGMVNTVIAGPGNTVYLGGIFTTVDGVARRNLAQVNLADGSLVTTFKAANPDGAVQDLILSGGRLFVAGGFTKFGSSLHGGLATLSPTTGLVDPYMGVNLTVNHNWTSTNGGAKAPVGGVKLDVNPTGDRLVVIGNFKLADGLSRDQLVMIDLNPTSAAVDPGWSTTQYSPACAYKAFDYYVRSVQFSPDGSYFVVVATGGPFAGTLCDAMTRWATAPTGSSMLPTWVDHTGGDTLLSVAVTGSAIYAGGHERWMNNTNGSDSAGQGAVPRPGLVAVDPRTGIPLAWNPGRNPRGVGAEALLATPDGLYVGSDTEWIGDTKYFHPRLAFFPLAGGGSPPAEVTGTLPANVFLGGRATATTGAATTDVLERWFDGTVAAGDVKAGPGDIDWSKVRGAFIADGNLYYGYPNAAASNTYYLFERSYDGSTYGAASPLDPYNDPYWSTVAAGTKNGVTTYYRGKIPAFYTSELSGLTGMFFSNGRLYYTRSGKSSLYYRGFSLDSGVVGADEFVAASTGFGDVAGMMLSGSTLYWASQANGQLKKMAFSNGVPTGGVTTASTLNWRTRAMFIGPGGPPSAVNQPPVAQMAATSCAFLACSIDGSGSSDPDGSITGYSWDFGDGTAPVTGSFATHTYAAGGDYTITLTVTDNSGATNSTSRSVTVAPQTPGVGISFRAVAQNAKSGVTSIPFTIPSTVQPGDGLVLLVTTNSAVTGSLPDGWASEDKLSAGTSVTGQVFSRVAQVGDAGSTVTVTLNGTARVNVQLVAYQGTSTTDPVSAVKHASDAGGTSHTTPTLSATAGSWVVSFWADKSSTAHSWTPPSSDVVTRSNLAGQSGQVAALLADGGTAVPNEPVGGLTATVPVASNQAVMFTIVVAPAA